jgi:ABC-type bacteriocin/lantibiotic exporter with double-glycine peptidase domain
MICAPTWRRPWRAFDASGREACRLRRLPHDPLDVSEAIVPGEVVVVCGPSGSGKSTLIRTINRLEPIQSGTISIEGQDIRWR